MLHVLAKCVCARLTVLGSGSEMKKAEGASQRAQLQRPPLISHSSKLQSSANPGHLTTAHNDKYRRENKAAMTDREVKKKKELTETDVQRKDCSSVGTLCLRSRKIISYEAKSRQSHPPSAGHQKEPSRLRATCAWRQRRVGARP